MRTPTDVLHDLRTLLPGIDLVEVHTPGVTLTPTAHGMRPNLDGMRLPIVLAVSSFNHDTYTWRHAAPGLSLDEKVDMISALLELFDDHSDSPSVRWTDTRDPRVRAVVSLETYARKLSRTNKGGVQW